MMKKKGIWILIIAVFGFILYDFAADSKQEQAVREEAEQTSELSVQENLESETLDLLENPEDLSEEELNELFEELLENREENNASDVEFGLSPGNYAYDFYLEDMDGNYVSLSDYRGKKVFLNFWASWCPPCRVEMPHLQAFQESNDDVVVLGVNVTSSESSRQNVTDFIDEYNLTFLNVYGEDDYVGLYQIESLPTSFFIDSEGIIKEAVVGPVTEDILNARFSMMD